MVWARMAVWQFMVSGSRHNPTISDYTSCPARVHTLILIIISIVFISKAKVAGFYDSELEVYLNSEHGVNVKMANRPMP